MYLSKLTNVFVWIAKCFVQCNLSLSLSPCRQYSIYLSWYLSVNENCCFVPELIIWQMAFQKILIEFSSHFLHVVQTKLTFYVMLCYRVFFQLVPPLNVLSTKKLILARLGVSRQVYVNVDSPNLGFPYLNLFRGGPVKNTLYFTPDGQI